MAETTVVGPTSMSRTFPAYAPSPVSPPTTPRISGPSPTIHFVKVALRVPIADPFHAGRRRRARLWVRRPCADVSCVLEGRYAVVVRAASRVSAPRPPVSAAAEAEPALL